MDTLNKFYFHFGTLSSYIKIQPMDPNCEDLLRETRALNGLVFSCTQNPRCHRASWLLVVCEVYCKKSQNIK